MNIEAFHRPGRKAGDRISNRAVRGSVPGLPAWATKVLAAIVVLAVCPYHVLGSVMSDKSWATDLPAFLNANPHEQWIVGHSTQPALSADEAETSALNDAAEQLGERLKPFAVDRGNLVLRLHRADLVVDRQIDATERPYGTIWKAAVLIDASPGKIDPITSQLRRASMQHHARAAAAFAGATVWFAIVCLGYLLFNRLSRGYFRGRLIFASLLLVAGGFAAAAQLL
jgi:hypothetical protein